MPRVPAFLKTLRAYFFVVLFFQTGSFYVAKAGLELTILLPQISECWDYRCAPPHLA
jgi:hypothetical protein